MTGFDETVPPDDHPARDENSVDGDWPQVRPDAPQPDDEQPVTDGTLEQGERQAKPSDDLAQDDELRAGQWGPTGNHS